MTEYENLDHADAVEKMKHIAKGETALFCTFAEGRMFPRPMATSGIDDDGTFWFMSRKDSLKVRQISEDRRVQLLYSVQGKSEYLSLEGRAVVTRDQATTDALWTGWAKTWFPDGKDDPELTLIKVTPKRGHYWDTKHGKMVQLAGMVFGAITGKETDDSLEGQLRV